MQLYNYAWFLGYRQLVIRKSLTLYFVQGRRSIFSDFLVEGGGGGGKRKDNSNF